jgi:hypothetical protein
MKFLYVISINDSQGRMQAYGIVATTRANAEAEARSLAGVGPDAEPATSQKLHAVDAIVS